MKKASLEKLASAKPQKNKNGSTIKGELARLYTLDLDPFLF